MKKRLAFLIAIATACAFAGVAEAGTFTEVIARLKINALEGSGQIPWPAFFMQLSAVIIGILVIRKSGKKS
jgi:hypothetical protein